MGCSALCASHWASVALAWWPAVFAANAPSLPLLCSTWETFLEKVCKKLGIDAIQSIQAESDGAEVEDVEELMTGDKLLVCPVTGGAAEAKQAAPAIAAGSTEEDEVALSPAAAAIDEAALSLRKRNGAGDVAACLRLVQKLINNARKPEAKFRSVRLTRRRIADAVSRHPQAIAMLAAAGVSPAQEGLTPPAAGMDKGGATAPAAGAGDDDPTPESLGLSHSFMVLPLQDSITLTAEELSQVLEPHLAWADRHTSTVAGSASYNMAKRELAKVRAAHGVSDAGSVPSDERWKLYPVYLAAKAKFDKACETAAPVPRQAEVSDDPHTRGAVIGTGDAVPPPEPPALGTAASTGGDMTQDDIVAQLGGTEALGAAQALLTAAGGPTSQAMAKCVPAFSVICCDPALTLTSPSQGP